MHVETNGFMFVTRDRKHSDAGTCSLRSLDVSPNQDSMVMPTAAWDDLLHSNVDEVATRPANRLSKVGDGVSAPTHLVQSHHPGYLDTKRSILFTLPICSIKTPRSNLVLNTGWPGKAAMR